MYTEPVFALSALFRDRYHRFFRLIFAGAFLLRILTLLLAFHMRGSAAFLEPDSLDYMRLAASINEGAYTALSGFPEIARTPGYPFFLWLVTCFCSSVIAVILIQVLFEMGILVLIYMIGLRLFSVKAAIFGILFYALSPLAVSGALKVLSETVFLFCFMLSLFLLIPSEKGKDDKGLSRIFLGGVLIGIACLLRAVMLPLIPLFLLYCIWIWRRQNLLKKLSVFLIPVLLVCGVWVLRNIYSSAYYGFSSISSVNTYRYNACALSPSLGGRDFSSEQIAFDRALEGIPSEKEKALAASERGWKLILAHPFAYIPVHLKGSFRALLPADGDILKMLGFETGGNGTLAVMQSKGLLAGLKHYLDGRIWLIFVLLPGGLFLVCEYAAAGVGLIIALLKAKRDYLPWVVLAILCVAYYLLVSGPAGHPRFRIPAEALICLFAGSGMSAIYDLNSSFVSGSTRRNSSM